MTETSKQRLTAHHGGAQFRDVMVRSFERRFGDEFWQLWEEQVAPQLGERPTLVDLGCGPGLMLRAWRERYPSAQLHGVELQPYMLDDARRTAREVDGHVHEADLHGPSLPLCEGCVDVALAAMVIHEMREPIGMLREVHRLLPRTGRLFIMDWVRVPLPQYLQGWDDDPFALEAADESRAGRIDHFMEHNKFSCDDLLWILDKLAFDVDVTRSRGDGQFLWVVAHPR